MQQTRKASGVAVKIFGGGTSITKSRRWRPQTIGGGSAGARLYLKDCYPIRLLCRLLLFSSSGSSSRPLHLFPSPPLFHLFTSPSSSPPSRLFLLLPLISLLSFFSSSSNHYPSPLSSSSSALPLLLLLFVSSTFFLLLLLLFLLFAFFAFNPPFLLACFSSPPLLLRLLSSLPLPHSPLSSYFFSSSPPFSPCLLFSYSFLYPPPICSSSPHSLPSPLLLLLFLSSLPLPNSPLLLILLHFFSSSLVSFNFLCSPSPPPSPMVSRPSHLKVKGEMTRDALSIRAI